MSTQVQKWGNSLGVRLPKKMADSLNLKPGSAVNITEQKGKIIIAPAEDRTLEQLLDMIDDGNAQPLCMEDEPKGREEW